MKKLGGSARRSSALVSRMPLVLGWAALALLLGGFATWSVTTDISGAIIVPGQIEVEQNRQIVQHPAGGVVGEVLVGEGDTVTAGQVLIRLDDTGPKSELAVIEGQYFELVARRGRLEAERDNLDRIIFDPRLLAEAEGNPDLGALIDGQARLFEARVTSLQSEASQLREREVQIRAQIDGLKAQLVSYEKQIVLLNKELVDQQTLLEKGLVQATRVLALQREAARLEGLRGEAQSSIAEAEGRIIEAGITRLRLDSARREDAITRLRDLQYREYELAERRLLAKETLTRLDIRAPSSGAVYGLQVHTPRSVIRPAEPVMYIIPTDRPLVIAARINPINIDEVWVGQAVNLRFAAFDSRTTPELAGRVVKLSADAFIDDATRTAYYRAEIVPLPEELPKLEGLALLPGMPVESFIRTADRTPLRYLIKPMADYFNKAFREG